METLNGKLVNFKAKDCKPYGQLLAGDAIVFFDDKATSRRLVLGPLRGLERRAMLVLWPFTAGRTTERGPDLRRAFAHD